MWQIQIILWAHKPNHGICRSIPTPLSLSKSSWGSNMQKKVTWFSYGILADRILTAMREMLLDLGNLHHKGDTKIFYKSTINRKMQNRARLLQVDLDTHFQSKNNLYPWKFNHVNYFTLLPSLSSILSYPNITTVKVAVVIICTTQKNKETRSVLLLH